MAGITRPVIVALFLFVNCYHCFLHSKRLNVSVNNYVSLVKDVHNYYGSSSVIFVQSTSYTDLNITTLVHAWSKQLSEHGIFSIAITLPNLRADTNEYKKRIIRPLYVVLLDTKEALHEFASATNEIEMSFPVWLIIFMKHPGNPLEKFCLRPTDNVFNVLFDTEMLIVCYDYPILKEWYAIRDNKTRVFNLATWTPERGLNLYTNDSLYARRNNMFGETLRVGSVDESPFISVVNGEFGQFFGGIVNELSKSMNFKIEILNPSEAYGSWSGEENAWTGVIGQLVAQDADFGASEFTVTNPRLEAVDFTLPLMLSRNRLYIKQPDGSAVQWSGYFKAFEIDIWAVIIIIIMTTPILLTIIKTKGSIVMRIVTENYIHVWGIYCQQGLSEFPNESSLRLAFFSIFISALIVSSAYSASLISFLTVNTASLPFSTLEGFVKDGSYKVIVFRNSADYDMIVNAKDLVLKKLKKLMKKKSDLPLTLLDGFEQVCNETVAFYVTEAIKTAMNFYLPCKIVFIETGRTDSLAMALPEGSPYTGLINYNLQRFQDNGVLNRLKAGNLILLDPPKTTYNAVNLWGIIPILAVLGGGVLLGYFILIIEKTYFVLKNDDPTHHSILKRLLTPLRKKSLNGVMKKNLEKSFKIREKHSLSNKKTGFGYWP